MKSKPNVIIYTDGACLGNPGPGGWAALLVYNKKEKIIKGCDEGTTNNRMELRAVIESLKSLKVPCSLEIYTDSKYVMDGFLYWLPGWLKRDWKNSKKKEVKNKDLWWDLYVRSQDHVIQWHWVKGHSGHPQNECVDKLAREAAEELQRELCPDK